MQFKVIFYTSTLLFRSSCNFLFIDILILSHTCRFSSEMSEFAHYLFSLFLVAYPSMRTSISHGQTQLNLCISKGLQIWQARHPNISGRNSMS